MLYVKIYKLFANFNELNNTEIFLKNDLLCWKLFEFPLSFLEFDLLQRNEKVTSKNEMNSISYFCNHINELSI